MSSNYSGKWWVAQAFKTAEFFVIFFVGREVGAGGLTKWWSIALALAGPLVVLAFLEGLAVACSKAAKGGAT